jgi:hypothetical protein
LEVIVKFPCSSGTARALAAVALILALAAAPSAAGKTYHCYFGNTHSHTSYSDGGKSTPAEHFREAKAAGYDFYAVTDHALSKYPNFTARSYEDTKRQADRFTDSTFVGISGFEFSENDGPGGKGHLTALNTARYLDATGPKVNIPVFYDWLATQQTTTVATSFNHPGVGGYDGYAYLTDAHRDEITMFEMINSGKLHYDGYLAALGKGWRVAPIAGQDGHGTWRITRSDYRTGVLSSSRTREGIMQAMRARRVYCTWDRNLRLSFSANGSIMGSVIPKPASLYLRVDVYDPDFADAKDRITRIDIIGENGALVESKHFASHTAAWGISVSPKHKYYFVQVYCADKTDGPTAYSAPVWLDEVEQKK